MIKFPCTHEFKIGKSNQTFRIADAGGDVTYSDLEGIGFLINQVAVEFYQRGWDDHRRAKEQPQLTEEDINDEPDN